MLTNHTWELVDFPLGNKPLGSKNIFKKKLRPDCPIKKSNARLVAKWLKQKEGTNSFDIYAPVIKITTIRVLIALTSIHDMVNTFLNGELDEEIYMEQPKEFIAGGYENKVCRLVKSHYSLKQLLSNGMKILIRS